MFEPGQLKQLLRQMPNLIALAQRDIQILLAILGVEPPGVTPLESCRAVVRTTGPSAQGPRLLRHAHPRGVSSPSLGGAGLSAQDALSTGYTVLAAQPTVAEHDADYLEILT